jgi:hypothetical protein
MIEVGIEAVLIERDDGRSMLSKRHRPSKASDSSPRWSVGTTKSLELSLVESSKKPRYAMAEEDKRTSKPTANLMATSASSKELVAETGADGDLVTALGATTVKNSGARLGLHARKKAVGLGAMAAIGLEGTLRHDKKLLRRIEHLLKLLGCCNNL